MFNIAILTIFPEIFPGVLNYSITGQAIKYGKCTIDVYDLKKFGSGKHNKVDDKIYGGGAGMLMRPDVLSNAIEKIKSNYNSLEIIYPSPRGNLFTQSKAKELITTKEILILCGRFEGIDQRIIEYYNVKELSIGDFILSNGEIAAFAIIDTCIRMLPGVISHQSLIEESFSENSIYENLLEYPQYTKPSNWLNHQVPNILLSGNHLEISNWRKKQAEQITKNRRKDLWKRYLKNDHS